MKRRLLFASLSVTFLSGCAGPMSPFGAINSWIGKREPQSEAAAQPAEARVVFQPLHQVLHGAVTFTLVLEDPEGVPEDFRLKVFYNGLDAAPAFLSRAERQYLDSSHRRLSLKVDNFRINATRDNHIKVIYRRNLNSPSVVATYDPPSCSAFESSRALASIPDFELPPGVLDTINQSAGQHKLNPYYIAGLIAQESGFDPLAVSPGKALGLTQVTRQGEQEVAKRFTEWPRYPGIEDLSLVELKFKVLNGDVNGANEWRLNPVRSVQGGVAYLAYLSEYWAKPDKRAQIAQLIGTGDQELSQVILASYNAGGARVSQAMDQHGRDWLQDDQLGEARRYIRRVASYCDYFTNRGE